MSPADFLKYAQLPPHNPPKPKHIQKTVPVDKKSPENKTQDSHNYLYVL